MSVLLQGWAAPANAQACKLCGLPQPTAAAPGWLSDRTVDLLRVDPDTGAVLQKAARGSPDSCCEWARLLRQAGSGSCMCMHCRRHTALWTASQLTKHCRLAAARLPTVIQQGMGTVMQRDASAGGMVLRALMCPKGFTGIATPKQYGIRASPCLACPPNMVTPASGDTFRATSFLNGQNDTSTADTAPQTGFFDARACSTPGGFGYANGSIQQCAVGWWGGGGAATPCTK